MKHANISLKGLEVFQAIARSGAVQDAARRLGFRGDPFVGHLVRVVVVVYSLKTGMFGAKVKRLQPADALR